MRPKKVFLVGPPFSGHFHPLLGIGEMLCKQSDVTVLSTPGAGKSCHLPFRPILAAHEQAIWEIAEPGKAVKGNPIGLYRQLKANMALMADLKKELDTLYEAEKPDLVIADFTVPVAGLSATQLGIPWWTSLVSPCVFETPDGPPAYCGGLFPPTTRLQHLQHAGLRIATRLFKRVMGRIFRRELRGIGLHGIYHQDGSEAVYSPQCILALGLPELEFARTYPPHFHFTGPVLHTPVENAPEPHFTTNGRPHVLISIGTHLPHAKADLAAAVKQMASRQRDIVFHFTHGNAATQFQHVNDNYHEYAYISYTQHLPRYDLVVHHGGAGVLNHCLKHGKPAVVFPQDFDQFDHAARLVATGTARRIKHMAELEPCILQALKDFALRERCREVSALFGKYDAQRILTDLLSKI